MTEIETKPIGWLGWLWRGALATLLVVVVLGDVEGLVAIMSKTSRSPEQSLGIVPFMVVEPQRGEQFVPFVLVDPQQPAHLPLAHRRVRPEGEQYVELPRHAVQRLKHRVKQEGERGGARAVGNDQQHPPIAKLAGWQIPRNPLPDFAAGERVCHFNNGCH